MLSTFFWPGSGVSLERFLLILATFFASLLWPFLDASAATCALINKLHTPPLLSPPNNSNSICITHHIPDPGDILRVILFAKCNRCIKAISPCRNSAVLSPHPRNCPIAQHTQPRIPRRNRTSHSRPLDGRSRLSLRHRQRNMRPSSTRHRVLAPAERAWRRRTTCWPS